MEETFAKLYYTIDIETYIYISHAGISIGMTIYIITQVFRTHNCNIYFFDIYIIGGGTLVVSNKWRTTCSATLRTT